nr:hypothetical protein [Kibdelosporangium sp. MJ126-NF4]CTQ89793.1 hypothetical protein [Kibdelosporangium sp. MJ126-NF4]
MVVQRDTGTAQSAAGPVTVGDWTVSTKGERRPSSTPWR